MHIFVFLLSALLLMQDAAAVALAGDGDGRQYLSAGQALGFYGLTSGAGDYMEGGKWEGNYPFYILCRRGDVYYLMFYKEAPSIFAASSINGYQVTFRNASGGRNSGVTYHSVAGGDSLHISSSSATNSIASLGSNGFRLMYANFPYTVTGPEPPDNVHLFPDDDILDYEGSVSQPTAAPTPSPAPTSAPAPTAAVTPVPTSALTPKPTATPTPAPTFPTRQPTPTPTPLPVSPGGDGTATGCALCVGVLLEINAKLDTAIWHLECAAALLLILVVFGTMRVVSRWSKGVNMK